MQFLARPPKQQYNKHMPTFDFDCIDCSHTFEFSRPFGSKELPECPKCGSKKTEKMIHAPNIQFKGEGFYKTDSAPKPSEEQTTEAKEAHESKEASDSKEATNSSASQASSDSPASSGKTEKKTDT